MRFGLFLYKQSCRLFVCVNMFLSTCGFILHHLTHEKPTTRDARQIHTWAGSTWIVCPKPCVVVFITWFKSLFTCKSLVSVSFYHLEHVASENCISTMIFFLCKMCFYYTPCNQEDSAVVNYSCVRCQPWCALQDRKGGSVQ